MLYLFCQSRFIFTFIWFFIGIRVTQSIFFTIFYICCKFLYGSVKWFLNFVKSNPFNDQLIVAFLLLTKFKLTIFFQQDCERRFDRYKFKPSLIDCLRKIRVLCICFGCFFIGLTVLVSQYISVSVFYIDEVHTRLAFLLLFFWAYLMLNNQNFDV